MLDGITNAGFSAENLDRRNQARFGWYLHLHGSPLFYDDDAGMVKKLTRAEFDREADVNSTHIVLTHVRHKPSIIASSDILTEYWIRLKQAIIESDNIILFGYSGLDSHLNSLIRSNADRRHILIVEWEGAGDDKSRKNFWNEKLKVDNELVRLANILDFTEW